MEHHRPHQIDQDRDRVDVSAEHECEFWLERFQVTFAELTSAVRSVGSRVSDLRIYFAGLSVAPRAS